jgi:hypothetical protein
MPLTSEEHAALLEALDDEYRALATYEQVLEDFGPVRPFVNIRDAEARHAEALVALCRRYGVEPPGGEWRGQVSRFASVQEACLAGVQGEIDNDSMYGRLIGVARHADVRNVFSALQAASRDHHLPAFRRCAERPREGAGRGGTKLRRRWRGGR